MTSWIHITGFEPNGWSPNASVRILWSVNFEKVASKRSVKTWVNKGDSIRSDVSSSRRRRGEVEAMPALSGEADVKACVEGSCVGGKEIGDVHTPDSCSTELSSLRGGRR